MSWQEKRARRRRARELERQLAELDDLDRRDGLGADASPRPRRRGQGGFLSCLTAMVVFAAVVVGSFALVPGMPEMAELRALGERLLGADTPRSGQTYDDGVDGEGGGPGYSFARTQRDGVSPVTWSCGATIPVEVNPQGAPAHYEALTDNAVSRLNQASTFTIEVTDETDDRDFLQRGPGPVLLGFADSAEIEELDGPVSGLGGAVYSRRLPDGELTAVGGMVVLDTDVFDDRLPAGHGEAIIIHELAHVLGLGHTDQGGELMQATSGWQTEMGPGDREGLAALEQHACS